MIASTPPVLVVRNASQGEIEIVRQRPSGPAMLVGMGLAVFGALPLTSPVTAPRLATALALFAAAALLVAFGRGRRERHALVKPGEDRLVVGERHGRAGEARAFVLSGEGGERRPRFRVELELARGERAPLLEGDDPAAVLADLARVRETWPLPVATGWGLDPGARPWESGEREKPSGARARRTFQILAGTTDLQRGAGWTVVVSALFTAALMLVMMSSRIQRGEVISTTSYVLPAVTVAIMLLAGAAILSERVRIESNGTLEIQRTVLGIVLSRWTIDKSDIRQHYLVSADGTSPTHVLLETAHGPVAFATAAAEAMRLGDALRRAL